MTGVRLGLDKGRLGAMARTTEHRYTCKMSIYVQMVYIQLINSGGIRLIHETRIGGPAAASGMGYHWDKFISLITIVSV